MVQFSTLAKNVTSLLNLLLVRVKLSVLGTKVLHKCKLAKSALLFAHQHLPMANNQWAQISQVAQYLFSLSLCLTALIKKNNCCHQSYN